MLILISPSKIDVPAGTVIRVPATWQDYQEVANGRGDGSVPRIKYCNGEMLLMVPLPEHGKDANLIARASACSASSNCPLRRNLRPCSLGIS
jgi:hypothetical protein